mmetsp:Transcript_7298/g.18076  ORF Transcript_7298/g.18076 Transcript_7298/m.18076 type:complete len:294 (-) Transcript_7298:392-1273(-)
MLRGLPQHGGQVRAPLVVCDHVQAVQRVQRLRVRVHAGPHVLLPDARRQVLPRLDHHRVHQPQRGRHLLVVGHQPAALHQARQVRGARARGHVVLRGDEERAHAVLVLAPLHAAVQQQRQPLARAAQVRQRVAVLPRHQVALVMQCGGQLGQAERVHQRLGHRLLLLLGQHGVQPLGKRGQAHAALAAPHVPQDGVAAALQARQARPRVLPPQALDVGPQLRVGELRARGQELAVVLGAQPLRHQQAALLRAQGPLTGNHGLSPAACAARACAGAGISVCLALPPPGLRCGCC